MRSAISRLRLRIGELEALDPKTVKSRSNPRVKALEISIDETLSDIFGHRTVEYFRYADAAFLDRASSYLDHPTPVSEIVEAVSTAKEQAIALLKQSIRSFEEKLALQSPTNPETNRPELVAQPSATDPSAASEIFIVHGHDGLAKTEVARLIERAGLVAVILHEQPNAGRTIIEKFEAHGRSVGFAIAILTPDDVGGTSAADLRPRARQNVIGEMFWFAGRLGRQRVCALKKGGLEMPSDFAGLGYTEMDDRGAWKAELLKELAAAGYQVDWRKGLA
jgi:predicted nucleotide-binding protein